MRTTSRRAWRVIGGGVGAATLLGLGYVATQRNGCDTATFASAAVRPHGSIVFSRNAKSSSSTRLAWPFRRT